jgi:hypothetical protein
MTVFTMKVVSVCPHPFDVHEFEGDALDVADRA